MMLLGSKSFSHRFFCFVFGVVFGSGFWPLLLLLLPL
jgi:hypothetical protein